MTSPRLEEFGARLVPPPQDAPTDAPVDYEAAYGAGWDDAMAQVDAEQGRISERLAARLLALELDRRAEVAATVRAMEPFLHEIFDKLLPRAAGRGFLGVLIDEIEDGLSDAAGRLSVSVAPEEAAGLTRLLERAPLAPGAVTVSAEPALALSQALLRWDDRERRVDLAAVLAGLDEALSDYLETYPKEPSHD